MRRRIIGPVSLSLQEYVIPRSKRVMRVYIFGDMHISDAHCPTKSIKKRAVNIGTFLGNLFNECRAGPVDFYLEIDLAIDPVTKTLEEHPRETQLFGNSNFLNDLWYTDFKSKCLRIHKIDIRSGICRILNSLANIFEKTMLLLKMIDKYRDDDHNDIFESQIYFKATVLKRIIERFNFEHIQDVESICSQCRITKQLDKLFSFRSFAPKIVKYFGKKIRAISLDIDDVLEAFSDVLHKDSYWTLDEFAMKLMMILVFYMDMYTLGRMLKNPVSRKSGRRLPVGKNVIVYAGEGHAENYRAFLNKMGFKLVKSSTFINYDIDFQCLDISMFRRPFFE